MKLSPQTTLWYGAYGLQKTMRAMDLEAELGAKIFVIWGGRKGVETDACRRPDEAVKGLREAINCLCEYHMDCYGYRFALEAKPNEPGGEIYMATTGHYLGFIPTLAYLLVGHFRVDASNFRMAGRNFVHSVAQAWEIGKLFHIDLNDQSPGRYIQDLRFGSANRKASFWLVKFLEDVGYAGPGHFGAHAYCTGDHQGVEDFCRRLDADVFDPQGQGGALERGQRNSSFASGTLEELLFAEDFLVFQRIGKGAARALLKDVLLGKRVPFERLHQLTEDILAGER